MFETPPAAKGALKLAFFISSLILATLAARLATADVPSAGHLQGHAAVLAQGLKALSAPTSSASALPRLVDAEKAPPEALVAIAPARPFVLKADAGDRQRAVQCLTQAVYFEAGFEPAQGEAAVAQVVLNRMRHPIFPHSVCGVVYQGAQLKTGCQFSFTCDGSLAKTPQKAAWERARTVATRALGGYVEKSVGEATHYHTDWVNPWWGPTVAKITQVGAHVFYRWPGAIGLPAAFVARYAGHERIVATPSPAVAGLMQAVTRTADGRVHAVFTVASNDAAPVQPATPRARMAALAAKGALGLDFDPNKLAPVPVATPAAATVVASPTASPAS